MRTEVQKFGWRHIYDADDTNSTNSKAIIETDITQRKGQKRTIQDLH